MSAAHKHEGRRRTLAAATLLLALVLCWSLQGANGGLGPAPTFLLVMMVCTATVFLTRGLGWRIGGTIGLVVGLAITAGLAAQFRASPSALAGFIAVSSGILALLGGLAGASHASGIQYRTSHAEGALQPDEPAEFDGAARRCAAAADPQLETLTTMVEQYCAWLESVVGRQCYTESADYSGFDQFVRTTLRDHLGAAGVRIYEVTSDGEWLEPLTRAPGGAADRLSAHEGAPGKAVSSGRVMVMTDASWPAAHAVPRHGRRLARREPPRPARESETQPGAPSEPCWLLPLRSGKRTVALVTVARIEKPGCQQMHVARAVRSQLQLFWRELAGLRSLSRYMRTDRQSGMLERGELINSIQEIARAAAQESEPVMVLVIALEGLRGLDDAGRWHQRDLLVRRLSQALRSKVRTDDLLGRFSDERFIVVMRRLDSTLGTRVAEKLLETVRKEALQALCEPHADDAAPRATVRLRAGLAGSTGSGGRDQRPLPTFDSQAPQRECATNAADTGKTLLERALGLVEYAREQRIELATDVMAGIPDRLARGPTVPRAAGAEIAPGATAVDEVLTRAEARADNTMPRNDNAAG